MFSHAELDSPNAVDEDSYLNSEALFGLINYNPKLQEPASDQIIVSARQGLMVYLDSGVVVRHKCPNSQGYNECLERSVEASSKCESGWFYSSKAYFPTNKENVFMESWLDLLIADTSSPAIGTKSLQLRFDKGIGHGSVTFDNWVMILEAAKTTG